MLRFQSKRLRRAFRRLARDDSGAHAMEFAVIAPIFFGITLSFYDMGLMMMRQVLLHSATDKAVRELRLYPEDALAAGEDAARDAFVSKVCKKAMIFPKCEEQLVVEIQPMVNGKFPDTSAGCIERQTGIKPVRSFNPSNPGTMTFMRVCAIVDPILPGYGVAKGFAKDLSGGVQVISTSAYMSE